MSVSVSPLESAVFTALGNFLTSVLLASTEVVQGMDNRVPEPSSPNFVTMTVLRQERLGTNNTVQSTAAQTSSITQETMVTVQVDIHGPPSGALALSSDNSNIISTLIRDGYAVEYFASNYPGVVPLYCEDPRMTSFSDDQQQVEKRWTVDVHLQVNPTVVVAQQSAIAINLKLVEIDEAYPPT